MAKVACGIGITWKTQDNNFLKLNIEISDIDIDGDVAKQIEDSANVSNSLWDTLVDQGEERLNELVDNATGLKPTLQHQITELQEEMKKVTKTLKGEKDK